MSKDIQEVIKREKQKLRCIHLADRSENNLCDAIKRVEQLENKLENSIPTEVIEEKKQWLEENILDNDYASENDKDIAEYQVNILQDLLENK